MDFCSFPIILLGLCFGTTFLAAASNPTYLKSDIFLNCGSGGIYTAGNGKVWVGDKNTKSTSFLQMKGTSTSSSSTHKLISGDPVIHKSARISATHFHYSFYLKPGHKILRLHFSPTLYKGFNKFTDSFTVEAGQFTLLGNFSASLTAQALAVNTFTKEFYVSVTENQPLNITFCPSCSKDKTYAFVNGIEITSVPDHLVYFQGQDNGAKVIGQKSVIYVDNNTAIEIIHRLNVQQDSISSDDEFGMSGMWGANKKQTANENHNLTWKRLVDTGFRYLIRIHISEIGLKMAETGHMPFKILINEQTVDTLEDIVKERDENGSLLYRDYVIAMKGRKQDSRRDISISFQSNNDILDGHVIVKGFEILKLSNTDNSLASPNPLPRARNDHPSWIIRWNFISVLSYRDKISAVVVIFTAMLNIIVHMLLRISEAKYKEEDNVNKPSERAERHCRRFTLAEIRSATRNFSDAFFIARGGFGSVYKAVIDGGQQTVAIKRLNIYSMQGSREFLTEIETLSELRHINLVSLIGYCNERGEMILVYEYMTGGTLADQLYKLARKHGNNSFLTWKQRLNICIGAGRGLDYLHTGHRIIHRDVKTSNILLDESLEAKVADFGLAKPEDRSKLQSHVSTNVRGTFGYFDPYYVRTHKLSRKSDTYAFGVVLLEVLCGRPVVDRMAGEDKRSLTIWVQDKISKGEVNETVDSCLIGEISPNSFKVFVEVAQSCLHDEPTKRPTMAQVVVQLELALGQQDVRNSFVPSQETISARELSPPNDETKSLGGTEQVTMVHEPSRENRDARKLKFNKPFQFSPWDGRLWHNIKPSKEKELVSKAFSAPGTKSSERTDRLSINFLRHYIPYQALKNATNNFNESMVIGFGAFGKVYVGYLNGWWRVAIKRVNPRYEIDLMCQIRHRCLVSIIGYCDEMDEMILIYEYMENGTLKSHLYGLNVPRLEWKERLDICIGVARGLHCLHAKMVIHRDVKSSNILLVENLMPKLADFGLSKAGSEMNQTHISMAVKGSIGYLDPEYFKTLRLSDKSDVYSFGIILFEVLCGRPPIDPSLPEEMINLAEWALQWQRKGELDQILDPYLVGKVKTSSLLKYGETAEKCLAGCSADRPSITDVLWDLECALQLQEQVLDNDDSDENTYNTGELLTHHSEEFMDNNSSPNFRSTTTI